MAENIGKDVLSLNPMEIVIGMDTFKEVCEENTMAPTGKGL